MKHKRIVTTLLLISFLCCHILPAFAAPDRRFSVVKQGNDATERRVALVIGNSAYRYTDRLSFFA